MKKINVTKDAEKLLSLISKIEDIDLTKKHNLHKTSKNNDLFFLNGNYKKANSELLFFRLRDDLFKSYEKSFGKKYWTKYNKEIKDKNDELRLLCIKKINRLERDDKEYKKIEQEKMQKMYYDSYEIPEAKDGFFRTDYKVKNVVDILFNEDFPKCIINSFETKGKKLQKITTSNDETFYVLFGKKSTGVRKYFIIDFEVYPDNLQVIKRNTLLADNTENLIRPIKVFEKNYPSISKACEDLKPFYSYSTICQKTRGETDQNKIDELFKKTHNKNLDLQNLKMYGCKLKRKI